MRFGIDVPNVGLGGDPAVLVEMARAAEDAGWDGFFVWDSVYIHDPPEVRRTVDPWVALAAAAVATRRIHLGTMVTPLPRRRPWNVARQCTTLDHLCGGRLILPVALGEPSDGGFARVGEATDLRTRADRLDESLAILRGLWSGEPFAFTGKHYTLDEMVFEPRPVRGTVPVWVVAAWPRPKSMRRALAWDGMLPFKMTPEGESLARAGYALAGGLTPEDVADIAAYAREHGTRDAPP